MIKMLLALSVAAFVAVSTHTADAAGPATLVATLATPHAPHPVLAVLQEQLQQEQEHAKGGVLCQLCIDEVLALINEVLNDILNGVILNSCGKLCGNIPNNKTKELCTVACDIVGIKKLVQYLNSTDPGEFNQFKTKGDLVRRIFIGIITRIHFIKKILP